MCALAGFLDHQFGDLDAAPDIGAAEIG